MVHVNNEDENYMYQIFSIQTSNTACENISRSLVDVLYVFSVTGFHLHTVVSPSLQIGKKTKPVALWSPCDMKKV